MEKVEVQVLKLISSSRSPDSHHLTLKEVNGSRVLVIIIGTPEAQAINLEITKTIAKRPLTHDLMKNIMSESNLVVKELIINKMVQGTYFSNLLIHNGFSTLELDARPSDAVVLALKFQAPIYVTEDVMREVAYDIDTDSPMASSKQITPAPVSKDTNATKTTLSFEEQLKVTDTNTLKTKLEEALNNEEYEKAAKIRDELTNRGVE